MDGGAGLATFRKSRPIYGVGGTRLGVTEGVGVRVGGAKVWVGVTVRVGVSVEVAVAVLVAVGVAVLVGVAVGTWFCSTITFSA